MILNHTSIFVVAFVILLLVYDSYKTKNWLSFLVTTAMFVCTFFIKIPLQVYNLKLETEVKQVSTIDYWKNGETLVSTEREISSETKTESCDATKWTLPGKTEGSVLGKRLNTYTTKEQVIQGQINIDGKTYFFTKPRVKRTIYQETGECTEQQKENYEN